MHFFFIRFLWLSVTKLSGVLWARSWLILEDCQGELAEDRWPWLAAKEVVAGSSDST